MHGQSVGQVKMIGSYGSWDKVQKHCVFLLFGPRIRWIHSNMCLQNWFYFGQQEQLQVMQKNTFTNNCLFYETTLYPPALTAYALFNSRASLSCSASASCHGCCKNSTLHTLGKYLRERGKKNDSEQSGGTMIDSNRGCGNYVGCVQFHIQ